MNTHRDKIFFDVVDKEQNIMETESLWGERSFIEYDERTAFIIKNTPFYVKNISFMDTVYAVPRVEGGYQFDGIADRSGNSTYRLMVNSGSPKFEEWWSELQDLGCTYESGSWGDKRLYAVNVPSSSNIYDVYTVMKNGLNSGVWYVQEAHVGHDLQEKRN